jgi:Icc-related predicted phosphoesterase
VTVQPPVYNIEVKLLIFSDIHSDLKALQRHMETEADYYFAAGDLVNWARNIDAAGEILQQRGKRVYVIPGNHESPEQIAQLCEKYGLNNFHGGRIEIDGYHVVGLGCSNPTPFDTPGEYSEEEIARRSAAFNGFKPMIAIFHCPPHMTRLDRIANLRHAGSTAVRDFLLREKPRYFFCGHIHEAAGVAEQLGQTSAMNVGKKGYLLTPEAV